jgi:hypothetical protein
MIFFSLHDEFSLWVQAPEQLQKEFFAVGSTEKEAIARAAHKVG